MSLKADNLSQLVRKERWDKEEGEIQSMRGFAIFGFGGRGKGQRIWSLEAGDNPQITTFPQRKQRS